MLPFTRIVGKTSARWGALPTLAARLSRTTSPLFWMIDSTQERQVLKMCSTSPDTINRGVHSPILLMTLAPSRGRLFCCKSFSWSSELPSDYNELCHYGRPCSGFLWSLDVHFSLYWHSMYLGTLFIECGRVPSLTLLSRSL